MTTARGHRLSDLRRLAGTWFFVVAFVGRLPVAMNVVGVLTLVAVVRGSIAEAGIVSAALGIGSGLGGPAVGAAADRWGQRRVLLVAAVLNTTALLVLAAVAPTSAPVAVLAAVAIATGACTPQVSPLTRARWLAMLDAESGDSAHGIRIALGYESMADEISFVGGPLVVGAIATAFGPIAPIVVSAAITLVAVIAFALHPTAVLARAGGGESAPVRAPARALFTAPVLMPVLGMVMMGVFFGSTLILLTEFMESRGAAESVGLVYGVGAVTSAIAAISAARLPASLTLPARWAISTAGMAVVGAIYPFVSDLVALLVLLAIGGFFAGLCLVTLFSAAADAAPAGRLSTTMTMVTSGIIVGQALTVAVVGSVAARGGYTAVAIVVAGAAGLALLISAADLLLRRPAARLG